MTSSPGTYKKKAVPHAVRRLVALKYGCQPGEEVMARCYLCGAPGVVKWWRLPSGRPSAWVSFGLTLDHIHPERYGGEATVENIALACGTCNRKKGARV